MVISFTVGADGRLPSGMTLGEAVRRCDAATEAGAVYYMVDCAHPAHVVDALSGSWTARIGGLRAKVAPQGQAGFRLAAVPEAGEPEAFADVCRRLVELLPRLRVIGGRCGRDHRHIGEIGNVFLRNCAA